MFSEKNVHSHKWQALMGVCILAFTAFLDATIVNTALPFIQNALHANILELQWIANIFTIVLSMTMIAVGKFADAWGRTRVFYAGVTIFAIAALGAGCSSSVDLLVFFRGLQSLGAAVIFVVSAALLSTVFPAEERVRAISIYGGVTGFGLMIGPFLGGILIAALSWRWVFWINLPLIVIGLILCLLSIKQDTEHHHPIRLDWPGLILLVVGLGALMYGIITGAKTEWKGFAGWAFLSIGIIAIVILIILDEMRKDPLLDLHIFKKHLVILAALSCSLAGVISTVFMFFDPLYLHILRKLSPLLIGCLIAVIPTAQALLSFVFGRLVNWLGPAILLFVAIITGFIAILLHKFIGLNTPILFLILPFFLLGITWGLSNSSMITAINQVIPPHKIGATIGTIATIWNLTGALLLAASTAIFHTTSQHSSFFRGFQNALSLNMVFSALILVSAIGLLIRILKNKLSI